MRAANSSDLGGRPPGRLDTSRTSHRSVAAEMASRIRPSLLRRSAHCWVGQGVSVEVGGVDGGAAGALGAAAGGAAAAAGALGAVAGGAAVAAGALAAAAGADAGSGVLAAAAGAAGAAGAGGLADVRAGLRAGRRLRFGGSACNSARSGFGSNSAGEDSMPTKFFLAGMTFAVSVRGRYFSSVKVADTSPAVATGRAQGVLQVPPVESVTSAPAGSDSRFKVTGVGALLPPRPGNESKDPQAVSNRPLITTTTTRFIRLTR